MFGMRAKKSLGQVFLISKHIAEAEAAHAAGKTVLEIGPGRGILTTELCKKSKRVIAVEKDRHLAVSLERGISSPKLKVINKDFFDADEEELELDKVDIVIANIPYMLSSKTIEWLSRNRMQAVLCLQKEFVEHMMAEHDTRNYSRLSVISSLTFRITKIMDVPRGHFRPIPKVDSCIIYLKPKEVKITGAEMKVISALMQHKKKTVRNAMMDCEREFGKSKAEMSELMNGIVMKDQRVFKLEPGEILSIASQLVQQIKQLPN
jgi:16S rRNA (adenine1518-N6/adenine1519-N6)-dimethyltransferase